MKKNSVQTLSIMALLTALSFIGFEYLRIDIPLPGGSTAVHFGNAFCVLAALLIGGFKGGLAGSIGMTIADLMVPQYVISAPKTFILKLCIGLVTGFVAHHIAKINQSTDTKYIRKWTIISAICGMGFNVIFDPLASFFYKNYILHVDYSVAKIFAAWTAGATFINAITSVIIASVLYLALRPRLKHLLK